jgi:hypothetical protein
MSTPAPATDAKASGAESKKEGGKEGEAAADDAPETEELYVDNEDATPLSPDALTLHNYLKNVETASVRDDYQRKRKWRFNISGIEFTNDSDLRISLFLGFVITDERPPSPGLAKFHKGCCPKSVPLKELRTVIGLTAAIT